MASKADHQTDVRLGQFLSLPQVEASVGIKKSKLYELMHEPEHPFPAPIHIGRRALWVETEVEQWKCQRYAAARLHQQKRSKTGL